MTYEMRFFNTPAAASPDRVIALPASTTVADAIATAVRARVTDAPQKIELHQLNANGTVMHPLPIKVYINNLFAVLVARRTKET